jgi:superoxide dismutase, Fe-Mn family
MAMMLEDAMQTGWDAGKGEYVLPSLPYEYAALEPFIDEQTMRLHHDKHHASYVTGLNKALAGLKEVREGKRAPEEVQALSRNLAFHGSGHLLHVLFWSVMAPSGKGIGGEAHGPIAELIARDFGDFAKFAKHFTEAANRVEGGGWAILGQEPVSGKLMILQVEKHQNLTVWGVKPLIALDVWEHAYYLKYQNERAKYVAAWMNVVDWNAVNERV